MTQKIWVISEGCYSDYGVVAVFARREDAEEALAGGMGDDIEELPFFPAGSKPQRFTVYRALGRVGGSGIDVEVSVYSEGEWNVYIENGGPPPKRPIVKATSTRTGSYIRAICGDRDAAIKAVKDRLAAAKAMA